MKKTLKAACLQLNNLPDRDANMAVAEGLVREAAAAGAALICTPEYSCQMVGVGMTSRLYGAQEEGEHAHLRRYRELAAELGRWILIGSLGIRVAKDRIANRSFLLNDKGDIVAKYDKIHLFDVDLPNGQSFRESGLVQGGSEAVVAATPWGGLGMSICYDIRFPALYQALTREGGARILAIPAAYSIPSGENTWRAFLSARAGETGSYVLAPAQCGLHEGTRRSWGHSMIVNPWGVPIAERVEDTPGVVIADLDLSLIDEARASYPVYQQARPFTVKGIATGSQPEQITLKSLDSTKGM